jgi:ligand-binding sensor domain-containing protein
MTLLAHWYLIKIQNMVIRFILFILFIYLSSPSVFSQDEIKSYLEGANITAIKDEPGYVWVATYGQGIYRYSKKDNSWENFSTQEGNLNNDLFFNIAVSKDYIWAGAAEGLYIYNKKKDVWTNKKFAFGGEMGNWIRALCYDQDQNVLWIGRFKNLTYLDVRRQRYKDYDKTIKGDSKTNNFTAISLDGDSLVWFGTEGGVHKYYKNRNINSNYAWDFYTNKDGRFLEEGSFVSISDLLFDNKFVWFGTDEFITKEQPEFNLGGIYIFDRNRRWFRISKKDGLPANGIYCLERTANTVWASVYQFSKDDRAEYGHGVALINRITGDVKDLDLDMAKIKTSTILSLLFDGTDIWIGTDNGLFRARIDNPLAHWGGPKIPAKEEKSSGRKKGKR